MSFSYEQCFYSITHIDCGVKPKIGQFVSTMGMEGICVMSGISKGKIVDRVLCPNKPLPNYDDLNLEDNSEGMITKIRKADDDAIFDSGFVVIKQFVRTTFELHHRASKFFINSTFDNVIVKDDNDNLENYTRCQLFCVIYNPHEPIGSRFELIECFFISFEFLSKPKSLYLWNNNGDQNLLFLSFRN